MRPLTPAELEKYVGTTPLCFSCQYCAGAETSGPAGHFTIKDFACISHRDRLTNPLYECKCYKQRVTPAVFCFGEALTLLELGKKLARTGWNGKGLYIELQTPDKNSKMTRPYIYMKTAQGDLVPWVASQTDMLEKDWIEVEVA